MDTIVVNGEPVVFGDTWGPADFCHLLNQVTEEEDHAPGTRSMAVHERVQKLHEQSYAEKNERSRNFRMRLSEKSFGFVAEDCCAEPPRKRFLEGETVPVLRDNKRGGTYRGRKKIRGCQCSGCNDTNIWSSSYFLQENCSVKFNI